MFSLFTTADPVTDLETASGQDAEAYARFFHAMLSRAVWLAPSAYEGWFLSDAHAQEHIDRTLEAAAEAFREIPAP